jgi:phosphopantothenoylcysteine synthetase/decarboxylase
MRPCLIVGGAPRVVIDAVRYLTVSASGATAVALQTRLRVAAAENNKADNKNTVQLLLSSDAQPSVPALRYSNRTELEQQLQQWLTAHPNSLVIMSAAINDYDVANVSYEKNGQIIEVDPGKKLPSQADKVTVHLRPASKVIDQLKTWGHRGPLIGFKFEDRATVLASAAALRERVQANAVVANSLCGSVQAIVSAAGVKRCESREQLLDELTRFMVVL